MLELDEKLNNIEQVGRNIILSTDDLDDEILSLIDSGELEGLPTGFKDIDSRFLGYCPHSINLLVAETNTGKSCFCMNIVANFLKSGYKVLYIDLDRGKVENRFRLAQIFTKQPIQQLLVQPKNKDDKLIARNRYLRFKEQYRPYTLNLDYIQKSRMKWMELEQYCENPKYDLIIIDYLQKLKSEKDKDSFEKANEVIAGIDELSEKIKTPFLIASQTGRETKKDKKKKSTISTPKGSGDIEDTATTLMNLERGEDENGDLTDELYITIAKQKNFGYKKPIKIKFIPSLQIIEDYPSQFTGKIF